MDSDGRQRRLTVLGRPVLVIPHLFAYGLLGYAALAVVVYSWLAALVTGRVPTRAHRFLGRWVGYGTRIYGYLLCLTDRYPPFDMPAEGADDYPVRAVIPERHALNRAAVLFRAVLVLPAWILGMLVSMGMILLSPFLWLAVLVMGRNPTPLRQAVSGVTRYFVRLNTYAYLLTGVYPGGLFGADEAIRTPLGPSYDPWAPEQPTSTAQPASTSTQSVGARVLIGAFIACGLGYFAAALIVPIAGGLAQRDRLDAASNLIHSYQQLAGQTQQFEHDTTACKGSATPDPCLADTFTRFSSELSGFATGVRQISFPSSASGAADALASTADQMSYDLVRILDGAGYDSVSSFESDGPSLDRQYQQLLATLGVVKVAPASA